MQKQKIKIAMLILAFIMTIFLSSCSEATVNPIPKVNDIDLLTEIVWVRPYVPIFTGNKSTYKMIFHKDSTVNILDENGVWTFHNWKYNANRSKVVILNSQNSNFKDNDTLEIVKLNDTLLTITSSLEKYQSNFNKSTEKTEPIISISGTISNPDNKTIPSKAKLYAVWHIESDSDDYDAIWGEGKINTTNNTFTFELNRLPLDILISRIKERRLSIAYLILVNQELEEGKLSDEIDTKDIIIGAVEDRAVIFTQDIENTNNWLYKFQGGFGWGKGVYDLGGFDEWERDFDVPTSWPLSGSVQIYDAVLLIPQDSYKMKFPNWF